MANREELHDLRQRAHEAGIEGNSKMTAEQLREAMKKVSKGTDPMKAKHDVTGR